jgi:hypothetical protein
MISNWPTRRVLGVSAWALLAFISWHYESTCGMFLSGECLLRYWDGIRWLALLKWIQPYQTLLGGLGALAGGTFVVIAARLSAKEVEKQNNARQRSAAVSACTIIGARFRDAGIEIEAPTYGSQPLDMGIVDLHAPQLASIHPMLASVILAASRDAKLALTWIQQPFSNVRRTTAARCYAIQRILEHVSEKLEDDGTFDFSNESSIPPGMLSTYLRNLALTPRQISPLWGFFDWSKV